jgi:hypothetical protein
LGQLRSLFAAVFIKPRKIYGRSLGQLNLCLLSGNRLKCAVPCEWPTSNWNGLGNEPLLAIGFVGHQALTGTRSQKANTVSRDGPEEEVPNRTKLHRFRDLSSFRVIDLFQLR